MAQKIVILNALQIATHRLLVRRAVDGVITRDVTDCFKTNVVNALVRKGALRTFHKNFKVNDVQIERQPLPKPRAGKVAVPATQDAETVENTVVTPARVADYVVAELAS